MRIPGKTKIRSTIYTRDANSYSSLKLNFMFFFSRQYRISSPKSNARKLCTPRRIEISKLVQKPYNLQKTEFVKSIEYENDKAAMMNTTNSITDNRPNKLADASSSSASIYSDNVNLSTVIEKLFNFSWEVSLDGLHKLLYIAPMIDWNKHPREICIINRKLIDFFRSPRTTIARVVCQVCGELFRIIKCTKRPEFDELVDILLCKTADTNRFIQRDANVALDKMVSYIPTFHSVRAICTRGPMLVIFQLVPEKNWINSSIIFSSVTKMPLFV